MRGSSRARGASCTAFLCAAFLCAAALCAPLPIAAQAPPEVAPPPDSLLDPDAEHWREPHFTPFDRPPVLRNRTEAEALADSLFTGARGVLRLPGRIWIGFGRALDDVRTEDLVGASLWMLVDRTGQVVHATIGESSGVRHVDLQALALVRGLRFVPALRRAEPTEVWVAVRLAAEGGR